MLTQGVGNGIYYVLFPGPYIPYPMNINRCMVKDNALV
jgi:hypothetical protein